MKLLLSPFPLLNHQQTLLFFFLIFLSSSTLIIKNSEQFTIQSDLDEDITIIPSDDNRRQFESEQPLADDALQTNHVNGNSQHLNSNSNSNNDQTASTIINKNLYSLKQSASPSSNEQFDPFSVTFEDYLKEASKSFAHHLLQQESLENGNKPAQQQQTTTPESPSTSTTTTTEYPNNSQPSFIIEEEDNLIKPKESQPNIDHFFPRSDTTRFAPATSASATTDRKSSLIPDNERVEIVEPEDETTTARLIQFTWRQHTTNKCSRSCGRGFKLFHYYCIDLKYNVRVSDENCLNSNLKKPNATSEETCNEFDCPPQWSSIEFRELSRSNGCQFNELECTGQQVNNDLYKRIQCMMIDKRGQQIYLDDSKCNELNDVQSLSLTSSQLNNNEQQQPLLVGESVESLGFHGSIAAAINVLGSLLKKTSSSPDQDLDDKIKLKYDDGYGGYKINQYQHDGGELLLPNYDTQLPKGYVIQIKSRGRNKQPQVKIIKAKRHSRSHRLLNRKLVQ